MVDQGGAPPNSSFHAWLHCPGPNGLKYNTCMLTNRAASSDSKDGSAEGEDPDGPRTYEEDADGEEEEEVADKAEVGPIAQLSGACGIATGGGSKQFLHSTTGIHSGAGDGCDICESSSFSEVACAVLEGELDVTMTASCKGRDLGMAVLLCLAGKPMPLDVMAGMGGAVSTEVLKIANCCRQHFLAKRGLSCPGSTASIPHLHTFSKLPLPNNESPDVQVAVNTLSPSADKAHAAAVLFRAPPAVARAATMAPSFGVRLEELLQLDVAVHSVLGSGSVTTSTLCKQQLTPRCISQLDSLVVRGLERRAAEKGETDLGIFVESIASTVQQYMKGDSLPHIPQSFAPSQPGLEPLNSEGHKAISSTAPTHKGQLPSSMAQAQHIPTWLLHLLAAALGAKQPQCKDISRIGSIDFPIDLLSDESSSADDEPSGQVATKLSIAELKLRKRRGFNGGRSKRTNLSFENRKRSKGVPVEGDAMTGFVEAGAFVVSEPQTAAFSAFGLGAAARANSTTAQKASKISSVCRLCELPMDVLYIILAFISADSDSDRMNESFLDLRSCSKHLKAASDYSRKSITLPLSEVKFAVSYLALLPHLESISVYAISSDAPTYLNIPVCDLSLVSDVVPALSALSLRCSGGHNLHIQDFPRTLQPWRGSLRRLDLHCCTLKASPRQIQGSRDIKWWTPDLPVLTTLSVNRGTVSHMDLSRCIGLKELYVVRNDFMSHLVLPSSNLLQKLTCSSNDSLLDLNLAGSTHLKTLICTENFHLERLLLNSCDALTKLCVKENASLSIMSLLDCSSLETLDFEENTLFEVLDLSGCGKLQRLRCICNESLTALGFTMEGVVEVHCHLNYNLLVLNLSKCSTLLTLNCCDNSSLQLLDVTNCIALGKMSCSENSILPSLDLSGCVVLTKLICTSNDSLEHVNVSDCHSLVTLNTHGCVKLGEVDISSCLALTSHISI